MQISSQNFSKFGNLFENIFSYRNISEFEIEKEILCLNNKETNQQCDILTKAIKINVYIFSNIISAEINVAVNSSRFPSYMKMADVTPVLKKRNQPGKNKYILLNRSKVLERCLQKQIWSKHSTLCTCTT